MWFFNTTLCCLFLRKSDNKFKSLPDISFCFKLKIIPSCHTLSYTFNISRKAPSNIKSILKQLAYLIYNRKKLLNTLIPKFET